MGLGGLITGGMGASGAYPRAGVPGAGKVGQDYSRLLNNYEKGQGTVYNTEAQYKPQYAALGLQDLGITLNGEGSTPGLTELYRGVNPGSADLMAKLNAQAGEQLDAGASLDPQLNRLYTQSIRSGQAARGMGTGPSDVFSESLGLTQFGNQLRQQRQGFAQGVAGMDSQEGMGLLQMGEGATVGATPTLTPSNVSYDMFNTAYNARAASGIANQNAQLAMEMGFNSFD